MRCTALTALFFALFALFSTLAYAAPVPQGEILKRQDQPCMWSCRDASGTPGTAGDPSRITVIGGIINKLIDLMGPSGNSTAPPTA